MALKEGIESVNGYRFSLSYAPWSRETLDAVWSKNQDLKTFLHLHAPYSSAMEAYLKERSTVNFFIKRDPRDLVVSLLNHYKNIEFNNKVVESLPNDDERLLYMIRNFSRRQTLAFMGWIQSPQCCVLDFRKLMGAHGGAATDEDAMSEMRKIASALHMKLSDNKLRTIYRKHFGKGWNFFRGKVGAWKDYFKDEHINAAKEEIGDLLIELGYEKNVDW